MESYQDFERESYQDFERESYQDFEREGYHEFERNGSEETDYLIYTERKDESRLKKKQICLGKGGHKNIFF